jgi:hypothetical protein
MSTTKNKIVSYDFEVTSFVGIEAPEGTDPETLMAQAKEEFVRRFRTYDMEIQCFQIYDSETGENKILTGPNKGQKTPVHGGTLADERGVPPKTFKMPDGYSVDQGGVV